MRPAGNTRVWRKNGRDVVKGVPQGRRVTHRARPNQPRPRSTWASRHPSPEDFEYFRSTAVKEVAP